MLVDALSVAVLALVIAAGWWVIDNILPSQIVVSVLGHRVHIGESGSIVLPMAMVGLCAIPGVLLLELAVVGWRASSLRILVSLRTRSSQADIGYSLLQQFHVLGILGDVLTVGVSIISGAWLNHKLRDILGLDLSLRYFPLAVQYAGFYVLFGFFQYWSHRVQHHGWFWKLHRTHHSADEFCVLTSDRVHPAENYARLINTALPLAFFGAPAAVVVGVKLFERASQYVRHSQLNWDFGWVGRYLVQSPAHHRLHHQLDAGDGHGNYGVMPLWDHVFGTWREAPAQARVIGVNHPYRHGLWIFSDLWRDYRDFWAEAALGFGPILRPKGAKPAPAVAQTAPAPAPNV